jgi:hypothetical protein
MVGERRSVAQAATPGATLFGLSGARLRQLGVVLLVAGFVLFLSSFVPVLLAFNEFTRDPFGSAGSIFGSFFLTFVLGAIAVVLLGIGGFALRFGLIRPVTGYVATEAAPAIRTAAAAIGEGIRESGFGAAPRTDTVVRVKCRTCGYLETEDAEFCSKCGQRL